MKIFRLTESYYFGGAIGENLPKLSKLGVHAVLSLREMPDVFFPTRPKLALHHPISDQIGPRVKQLIVTSTLINAAIESLGIVYVHCHMGVHRAPNVSTAWLMSQGYSLEDAIGEVLMVRPKFQDFIRIVALEDYQRYLNVRRPV